MSQSLVLDCKGEHTYASDLSGVPPGSMSLALNVNISRLGIVEPRRGYAFLTYSLASAGLRAKKLVFWNSELFAHDGTTFYWYNNASGFTSRGSLATPTNATSVRAVKSLNKNLYITSSTGIQYTDAVATNLRSAGIPKGVTIDLTIGGAGTAVADLQYVTYRYLIARKDANANVAKGGVSGSFTIQNTGFTATRHNNARCYLPSGLDTSHFLQLYRTSAFASSATLEDTMGLCYEVPVASGDITNGYIDIIDVYPDSLLGAYLYTNASQEGLVNDNARPPLARDLAEFKNCMFYADVDSPQRLTFTLIAAATAGLVAGDTIIVTQGATVETYTAHATVFNSAIKQFIVANVGSTSQNIDAAIKSFIKCVNLASTVVYAYSQSSAVDLPGKALLEAKTVGAAAFTVTSARSSAFISPLVIPATVNNTSSADTFANGLAFSKPNQPEAVPIKNLFKVGASDDRIKRIVALRDALLIFKEYGGTYVLTGADEAHFAVRLLDSSAKVLAPDSIDVVNNFAYGLFQAGICEVSPDGGVDILSTPIKDQLLPLNGGPLAAVKSLSFGFGSEVDGKYILCVPQAATDTYAVKQHVYDTFGKTFCRWDLAMGCGGINPTDSKIYYGVGNGNQVKIERKAYDYTDYADYKVLCTVSSYSGTTVFIDNIANMAVGDILYQGTASQAYVESVNAVAGTVVIDSAQVWTLGVPTVVLESAINCKVQWNPDTGGNASGLKMYSEATVLAKQAFQKSATIYFSSDVNPGEASITIASASGNGAFGQFVWGDEVWGGDQTRAPRRIGVPGGHARCTQLSVRFETRVAYSDFQLEGISLSFTPTSTRTTR
jgi:hypothetical protein